MGEAERIDTALHSSWHPQHFSLILGIFSYQLSRFEIPEIVDFKFKASYEYGDNHSVELVLQLSRYLWISDDYVICLLEHTLDYVLRLTEKTGVRRLIKLRIVGLKEDIAILALYYPETMNEKVRESFRSLLDGCLTFYLSY